MVRRGVKLTRTSIQFLCEKFSKKQFFLNFNVFCESSLNELILLRV